MLINISESSYNDNSVLVIRLWFIAMNIIRETEDLYKNAID